MLDATQHLARAELGDRTAQKNPHAERGNREAGPQPWMVAGRGLRHIDMHCVQPAAPRSAATFNSKACQLREVRNRSCGTSEWEPLEGTDAFYTRLADQLSACKKPPSPALPSAWQRVVCGLVVLFMTVAPGPSMVLAGTPHAGAAYLGAVSHAGTGTPRRLDCRCMKARTLRAAFREFFCNGCAQTKKKSGLLPSPGRAGKQGSGELVCL